MMKPVNKQVYVKPDMAPQRAPSGLYLPQTNAMQSRGVVRASDSELCKVGDVVAYARFFPIKVGEEELITVHQDALIGVDAEPDMDARAKVETQGAEREAVENGISLTPTGD